MSKRLFMETTKISPDRTVGEIQEILGHHGATHILLEYENGEINGVIFNIRTDNRDVPFRLPCRWQFVLKQLLSRIKDDRSEEYMESKKEEWTPQAKRIAWRQILRWVEAQLALVETEMVNIREVFMPYLIIDGKQTLYEKIEAQGWKFQLEHKKS